MLLKSETNPNIKNFPPKFVGWIRPSAENVLNIRAFRFLICLGFSVSCFGFSFASSAFAQTSYAHAYEFSDQVSAKLSKNISLDLRKIDVVDVLKFLSTKAVLNIVTSQNVNSKVTLFLKDVTVANALDIILISTGLAVREKDAVLYVMTEEEYVALYGESYRDQRHIKMVQVKYINPAQLSDALGNVKSSIGKVIIDKPTGTVVLIDTQDKVDLMEKMIEKLDIPTIERILPTETQVFELSYNKVATLEPHVKLLLTEGAGKVQSDEKTNRLIVTDFPHVIRNVSTLIKAFDRKTREVFIETKMVQVALTNAYEMGIDWQKVLTNEKTKFPANLNADFGFPSDATRTRFGHAVIGSLTENGVTATVDLLHTFGDTKTLASPQITVENGKEAMINVGSREAYVTSTVSQASSTTTSSESITFIDVGVQLKVTPEINQDGFISMQIKPEVSAVRDTLTTNNGNKIPIVNTTNASTQVTVKDGSTVLIGGLMKDSVTKEINKFPVLGDIPWIGAAFRYSKDTKVKTELVIFLTPHIVNGDELYPYSPSASSRLTNEMRNFSEIKEDLENRIAKLKKSSDVSTAVAAV